MNSFDRRDGGFTLIEAAVALLIATFIFVALGQTIATALRASGERRLEQQASALTAEVAEAVRSMTFEQVALLPSTSDPTRLPGTTFDPGTGAEVIVEDSAAGISAQVTTETFNTVTYTLTRYITWVDDDPLDSKAQDYKRLTVVANWDSGGQARAEELETLIALQQAEAGTSNPTYGAAFDPPFASEFGKEESDVVIGHTITNIGNRDDRFDITVVNDLGWPVSVREAATGTALVDSTGNGIPDTGLLLPSPDAGSTVDIEVVVSIPAGTAFGERSVTIIEATSATDPDSSSSASDRVTSTGAFASVDVDLFLKSGMGLSGVAPVGSPSTVAGENGTTFSWSGVAPESLSAASDGTLELYVTRRGTCAAGTIAFTASVGTIGTGTWASVPSGDIGVSTCDPVLATVVLPIDGALLPAGDTIFVQIDITKVSGGAKAKRGLTVAFDGLSAASNLAFKAVRP
ncbi:MAG: type II secretion system protein [Acidimicrobiia bacterium]|nr:type II secretion system GspH family protein [Acidimicrobiia bacterium]MBT8192238.1 type II secretion system GspH family protein [Acidimicrobiia bacterium]NNL97982.1 type II secretion system protein [Acidimicrobiia bacterium]RZV46683.1 MAG: type II secretion system protein [Acidimicrobiia bacterium]